MATLTSWEKHKFLHGKFISCVTSTIDDIKCWNRKDDFLVASQVCNVSVKRNSLKKIISKPP